MDPADRLSIWTARSLYTLPAIAGVRFATHDMSTRCMLHKGLLNPNGWTSYIKPHICATALIQDPGGVPGQGRKANAWWPRRRWARWLPRSTATMPVRGLLLSVMDRAERRVGGLGRRLAEWFVAGMDRAGGWYERQVTWFLLAVATVAVSADPMLISEQLWAGRCAARRVCCRGGGSGNR